MQPGIFVMQCTHASAHIMYMHVTLHIRMYIQIYYVSKISTISYFNTCTYVCGTGMFNCVYGLAYPDLWVVSICVKTT